MFPLLKFTAVKMLPHFIYIYCFVLLLFCGTFESALKLSIFEFDFVYGQLVEFLFIILYNGHLVEFQFTWFLGFVWLDYHIVAYNLFWFIFYNFYISFEMFFLIA